VIKMNDHLTEEGSRRFFKMLRRPNPAAVETRRCGKELLKDIDVSKIGKEPVRMLFKIKEREDKDEKGKAIEDIG